MAFLVNKKGCTLLGGTIGGDSTKQSLQLVALSPPTCLPCDRHQQANPRTNKLLQPLAAIPTLEMAVFVSNKGCQLLGWHVGDESTKQSLQPGADLTTNMPSQQHTPACKKILTHIESCIIRFQLFIGFLMDRKKCALLGWYIAGETLKQPLLTCTCAFHHQHAFPPTDAS